MRLPTQSTLAFATLFSALATCGAAPDVASNPPTGTVAAAGSTDPPLGALPTTTQPVTVTNTSAVPTTSVPAIADTGDLYALDVASRQISRLTTDPGLDGAPAWMPDGERLLFGRLAVRPGV